MFMLFPKVQWKVAFFNPYPSPGINNQLTVVMERLPTQQTF
ncbi:hypothetical protein [Alteromonas sp. KUL49]|nr:hypothetical protein [Alteromonas sp. KUL49]